MKILVIGPRRSFVVPLRLACHQLGHESLCFDENRDFEEMIRDWSPEVAILDWNSKELLPQAYAQLDSLISSLKRVIWVGPKDLVVQEQVNQDPKYLFVILPINPLELVTKITQGEELWRGK